VLPGRELLEGDVFDINLNGGVLVFPRASCPRFADKNDAMLQLRIAGTGKTLPIPARHVDTYDLGDRRQCWFEFKDPTGLFERLGPDLRPHFNRRHAFRVEPPPEMRVAVALAWEGGGATGALLNISATGMAVELGAHAAARLGARKSLALKCSLPGADAPLCLEGDVRSSRPTALGISYGIAFAPARTAEFKEQEATITRYVVRRQLETLKARADQKD
jgi:hypothetical protein